MLDRAFIKCENISYLIIFDPTCLIYEKNKHTVQNGIRNLDADTVICPDSYQAALLSAGAGLEALDKILDETIDNAFCAVRPPGHHAEKSLQRTF